MTEDERKQAIKAVLPDNVDGETRPTDSVPTDFPLSTDFPQLIGNDPVSADVFNLVNRQMLSNDKALQELISTSSGGGIKSVERKNDTLKFTNSDSTTLSVSINDISHATNADNATKADTATKADSTTKLATARTITLSGKATGSASFDGSANASINVTAVTADSCSGNSATASEVAWTGITGKPSTYTPATHNHDTSYPSTSGSRATGTWGISVTGSAGSVAWDNVTGKPSTYTPASHTHSYLPLSGGTLSNPSNTNGNVEIHRDVSSGSLGISGGSEVGKGATLYLCGEDSGRFTLRVSNTSSIKLLTAEPSGTLMWGGDDLNGAAIKFKSLSTSVGIIWYKSGLIFQWGQKELTAGTTSYTVNLPLTTTKNHNIQITTTTNIVPRIADIVTNSSFNVTFNSSPTSSDVMHWLVIGYLD